jgi:leader peptidase (prepilin peptidase)/N-methyltransferase
MTWALVPAYGYLAALTIVLTVTDIRTRTLPNGWTLSGYPILIGLLALPAAVDDRWDDFWRALLGAALTLVVFTGMALLTPQGLGMGDAKLAGVLAFPLTFAGWLDLVLAMAGAFVLSALVSIALLLLRRVDRRALIPFGPFLMGATWLVIALR